MERGAVRRDLEARRFELLPEAYRPVSGGQRRWPAAVRPQPSGQRAELPRRDGGGCQQPRAAAPGRDERLAAPGVEAREHGPVREPGARAERLQGRDGHELGAGGLGQRAGRGHADPQPGERPRPDADADPVDVGPRQPRVGQQLLRQAEELLDVPRALPRRGDVAALGDRAVAGQQADDGVRRRRVEREDPHGPSPRRHTVTRRLSAPACSSVTRAATRPARASPATSGHSTNATRRSST
jgi:hypothetical protein